MKNKKKSKNNILSKVVTLLLISAVCFTAILSSLANVYAHQILENGLTAGTYAELQQRMSRDTFTHEGRSFHIDQYFNNLFANRGRTSGNLRITAHNGRLPIFGGDLEPVVFREIDPITSFIPEAVFRELTNTGVYTFMGHEWGVIIEVSMSFSLRTFFVQVIDIIGTNNIALEEHQHYSLEIRPLFEVQLILIDQDSGVFHQAHGLNFSRTGPSGVYAFPVFALSDETMGGIIPNIQLRHSFPMSRRNHIVNFAFTGIMVNEHELNPGDIGFDHDNDFGHFYTATNLYFSGVDATDLVTPRLRCAELDFWDSFRTFGGVLSLVPQAWPLGIALTAWDVFDFVSGLTPSSRVLPPEYHFNVPATRFEQRFFMARDQQLQQYEQLIKDASIAPLANTALSLQEM